MGWEDPLEKGMATKWLIKFFLVSLQSHLCCYVQSSVIQGFILYKGYHILVIAIHFVNFFPYFKVIQFCWTRWSLILVLGYPCWLIFPPLISLLNMELWVLHGRPRRLPHILNVIWFSCNCGRRFWVQFTILHICTQLA